ncbi:MAG: hypothetical protein ACHP6I_01275 [Rickettsiales bacterium]
MLGDLKNNRRFAAKNNANAKDAAWVAVYEANGYVTPVEGEEGGFWEAIMVKIKNGDNVLKDAFIEYAQYEPVLKEDADKLLAEGKPKTEVNVTTEVKVKPTAEQSDNAKRLAAHLRAMVRKKDISASELRPELTSAFSKFNSIIARFVFGKIIERDLKKAIDENRDVVNEFAALKGKNTGIVNEITRDVVTSVGSREYDDVGRGAQVQAASAAKFAKEIYDKAVEKFPPADGVVRDAAAKGKIIEQVAKLVMKADGCKDIQGKKKYLEQAVDVACKGFIKESERNFAKDNFIAVGL